MIAFTAREKSISSSVQFQPHFASGKSEKMRLKPVLAVIQSFLLLCVFSITGSILSAAGNDPVPVTLIAPIQGTTEWIEKTTGQLVAPRRAILKIRNSGYVGKVMVREGDRVKKGQPLAVLDLEDAEINLQSACMSAKSAETQIEAAKAALETANVARQQASIRLETTTLDFERAKALRAKDTIPQQQLDHMEGEYKLAMNAIQVADSQIKQARAAQTAAESMHALARVGVRNAEKRLKDSSLFAPFDGLIVAKTLMEEEHSEGQSISIVDDSVLELKARLPERILPFIRLGARVMLHSPLLSKPVESGVNTVIPAIDPQTLTFEIITLVSNDEHKLSHGGYADVDVVIREEKGYPVVPNSIVQIASTTDALPGEPRSAWVYTVNDGKACRTPVTVGLTRNSMVSILAGLASGTMIVDKGFNLLSDGVQVRVDSEANQ